MKKFLVTILAIVYLATSTGATMHMHYCMGKIYSVDFIKKTSCSKCGMEANSGCCKDEFKVIKIKDNHQQVDNKTSFNPFFAVIDKKFTVTKPVFPEATALHITNNNSPPLSSGKSLCILNCVFKL